MTRLVLKGHPTRGKEVIQLLVILGAKSQYTGTFKGFYYWIEDGQVTSSDVLPKNSIIFSLEEFEEKYPYKVGDTVALYVGLILEKEAHTIIGMRWDSDKCRILYYLDDYNVIVAEDILYIIECEKEQSNPKRIKDMDLKNYGTATIKYIQENGSRDMELVIPHNQEIVNIDGRYILRDKKPQYPKTYEECCEIVDYHLEGATIIGYKKPLLENLQQLLICRDAWWKMAGEQMGLGKPWKPDWTNFKVNKFCIGVDRNVTSSCNKVTGNKILAFPTAEMRDAFFEDFKELIEQCKELL